MPVTPARERPSGTSDGAAWRSCVRSCRGSSTPATLATDPRTFLDRRPALRPSRDARVPRPAHAARHRARIRPDARRDGCDRRAGPPIPRDDRVRVRPARGAGGRACGRRPAARGTGRLDRRRGRNAADDPHRDLMAEPVNVDDFEELARARLDPGAYGYFAGGAGDEHTLRENRAAFTRWQLRPRVLVDVGEVTTATTVLGSDISFPLLVAPTAFQRLAHPEGELATARAAAAAGTIMCLSTLASVSPAVLVSNHGGRQLDGVPATLDVLPEVVEAVGERVEVLFDGGIRRGADVLKALALGARVACSGRAILW